MARPSARGVTSRSAGPYPAAVDTEIAIDSWARDVAVGEALRVRSAVREAMLSGSGSAAALHEVRRRLARLTPEQHALVVAAIVEANEPAA